MGAWGRVRVEHGDLNQFDQICRILEPPVDTVITCDHFLLSLPVIGGHRRQGGCLLLDLDLVRV